MKMLVPVDGSEYSLKAVETACDLAKAQPSSSLVLVAVAIEIPELEEGRYIADKMKAQAEVALTKAKEVAAEMRPRGEVNGPGHRGLPGGGDRQSGQKRKSRSHRHRQPGPGR